MQTVENLQPTPELAPQVAPTLENNSVPGEDRIGLQTIYSSSYGTIFYKNLVAGLGRGLGMVLIQVIGLAIFLYIAQQVVLPHLTPMLDMLRQTQQSLEQLQGAGGNSSQPFFDNFPQNINLPQDFLQQFQQTE